MTEKDILLVLFSLEILIKVFEDQVPDIESRAKFDQAASVIRRLVLKAEEKRNP